MANLWIQADSIQQEWKEEKFIGRRSAESNTNGTKIASKRTNDKTVSQETRQGQLSARQTKIEMRHKP